MGHFGKMGMRNPVGNDVIPLCLYMLQLTHKGPGNAPESCIVMHSEDGASRERSGD